MKLGATAAGAVAAGGLVGPRMARADVRRSRIPVPRWQQELPTLGNGGLARTLPTAPFETSWDLSLFEAPEYYRVTMRKGIAEIVKGIQTEIWGYDGRYPGPVFLGRSGKPDLVRFTNELPVETSVHQHGGHNPSDSDGLPFEDQLIHPGRFKDYYYPNADAPGPGGERDRNESPSFLWYHDHATDVTGPNIYMGLAGVYAMHDGFEDDEIGNGHLPELAGLRDIPLVLQDRAFNADGSLFYSPFDHDGFLGDVMVVNGKAYPYLHVERAKYRFRILNGANARFFMLRLSNGSPFLQIGADRWLLPNAIQRRDILLSNAEAVDVIVDFTQARKGDEVYLVDLLRQDDGRGPDGKSDDLDLNPPGEPLVKFIVGDLSPTDVNIGPGSPLRPHTEIRANEVVRTRRFEFDRRKGAWQINDRFFDEDRPMATVKAGTVERWILENGGGGWWHPVHIHLSPHQVVRFNGRRPQAWNAFKKDTTLLGPKDEAEVLIRFTEWTGRFVMHCHNAEHEDNRMMARWDVAP